MEHTKNFDYIIIGSGIIGLAIAFSLKDARPGASILIMDKERQEASHASGRNSGVLHAGFYYTADSLKAKFTVDGNRAMKAYCKRKNIALNECGKLVVAVNEQELAQLDELYRRGTRNGSHVKIISAQEAKAIDPNVKTYKKALYSPDTASVNPTEVCNKFKKDLLREDVVFAFDTVYLSHQDDTIETTQGTYRAKKLINCAGLYADKIAQDYGFGDDYTMLPFKGLYLKYTKNKTDVKVNIYPVPNLNNPFLGVHFTKTVTGDIKIGPTAIPAFWREHYGGLSNFDVHEFAAIIGRQAKLFFHNSFGFRDLAFEEIRKHNKKHFIQLARDMVEHIDVNGFTQYTEPGIRAQLLHKRESRLVQDFIIEGDQNSTHVLNAVSPGFTCAFPFSQYVVKSYILV